MVLNGIYRARLSYSARLDGQAKTNSGSRCQTMQRFREPNSRERETFSAVVTFLQAPTSIWTKPTTNNGGHGERSQQHMVC